MIFIPMPRGLAATPHPALLAELFDGRPATPAADPPAAGTEPARGLTLRPALDLCESRTAYTLTVDLPGARRESVKIRPPPRRGWSTACSPSPWPSWVPGRPPS